VQVAGFDSQGGDAAGEQPQGVDYCGGGYRAGVGVGQLGAGADQARGAEPGQALPQLRIGADEC
jgi:hypothetical protein